MIVIDPKIEARLREAGDSGLVTMSLVMKDVVVDDSVKLFLQPLDRVGHEVAELPNRVIFLTELGIMSVTGTGKLVRKLLYQNEVIGAELASSEGIPTQDSLSRLIRLSKNYVWKKSLIIYGSIAIAAIAMASSTVVVWQTMEMRSMKEDFAHKEEVWKDKAASRPAYDFMSLLGDSSKVFNTAPQDIAYEVVLTSCILNEKGINARPERILRDLIANVPRAATWKYENLHRLLTDYERLRQEGITHEKAIQQVLK